MVTNSHHWLKAIIFFPSNFSGFSIFRQEVCVLPGLGSAYCWALAMPSATSCTSSCGVNVGRWFLGGDCRGDGVGGSSGDGGSDGGLEGGLPLPAPCGFLQPGGVTWPTGMAGMAGGRVLLIGGKKGSQMGLHNGRQVGSGCGTFGAVGALVLEGLAGLHQSCSCSGVGALGFGDPGRGIRVAICLISSRACRNSHSTLVIFLWWPAAHSSTLPWKVARCCPLVVLASPRKASVSFTQVSWVA